MNPLSFNRITRVLAACMAFAALVFIVSCRKDDDTDTPPDNTTPTPGTLVGNSRTVDVVGQVFDESGNPLTGAAVKAGYGAQSTLTDERGFFRLLDIAGFENIALVKVSKAGYFDGSRSFVPTDGQNRVRIALLAKNDAASFSAAAGGQVSLENVTIDFAPGSIALNGQPYSGNVNVAINSIDPSDTWNMSQQMPGSLVGANGQQFDVLRSLGMAGVELTAESGQELQLLSGNTATVRFEVPASLLADAPSTIPLWHYSESQGYWVREGEATLNSNVYEGEVSHFSFWNCDIPAEAVLYNLTLLNDELVGSAIPIEGAHVVITSNVFGAQDGYTDSNGMVSGLIPANELLEVSVYVVCGNSETLVYNATIGPITEDYSNNWSIDLSSIVAMLQGTLLSASGSPIDGYVYLTSGGYVSTLNGSYQLPACTGSGELTGWYYDGGDICTSNSITVNLNTGINEYDIQVLGCFSISQPGEGVTDIDGNFYPSIIIAEQEWMASNLRTTRYANGDVIPELQEGSLWDNTTNGAWCDYANDNSLDIVFGKLYNGYAVVDNRNVCPTGWHVPTEEEVENMLFVLDPETELYSEIAGGMLKQEGNIVDGNGLWAYPNEGASNATGFAAVPGGWRIEGFGFSEGDSLAAILTRPQSLSNPPDEFLLLMMEYSNTQGGLFGAINVQGGGSIRCVRD